MSGGSHVLVACGLAFEARIARGSSLRASVPRICCGMLRERLAEPVETGCDGIISFGIAGGLDPAIPAGAVIVASSVIGPEGAWPTGEKWSRHLLDRCPGAVHGAILGADAPLQAVSAKQNYFQQAGALAVDMESHIAAAFAAERNLPFAVLRAVADPADRAVPSAALLGKRPDGALAPLAIMKMLMRKPADLPAILSLTGDVFRAVRTLARARSRLGDSFGLDLG
jgi:hopanoid-associated phosphorylase